MNTVNSESKKKKTHKISLAQFLYLCVHGVCVRGVSSSHTFSARLRSLFVSLSVKDDMP